MDSIRLVALIAQAEPADTMVVTQSWMAGVVGMMVLFGVIALIGYLKKKGSRASRGG